MITLFDLYSHNLKSSLLLHQFFIYNKVFFLQNKTYFPLNNNPLLNPCFPFTSKVCIGTELNLHT